MRLVFAPFLDEGRQVAGIDNQYIASATLQERQTIHRKGKDMVKRQSA